MHSAKRDRHLVMQDAARGVEVISVVRCISNLHLIVPETLWEYPPGRILLDVEIIDVAACDEHNPLKETQ